MSRYIGLHRPWGYKYNCFMLFYTKNPELHTKIIQNKWLDKKNHFFKSSHNPHSISFNPVILYSNNSYIDYKKIHFKMYQYFRKEFEHNDDSLEKNHFNWPFIFINHHDFLSYESLDEIINNKILVDNKKLSE